MNYKTAAILHEQIHLKIKRTIIKRVPISQSSGSSINNRQDKVRK